MLNNTSNNTSRLNKIRNQSAPDEKRRKELEEILKKIKPLPKKSITSTTSLTSPPTSPSTTSSTTSPSTTSSTTSPSTTSSTSTTSTTTRPSTTSTTSTTTTPSTTSTTSTTSSTTSPQSQATQTSSYKTIETQTPDYKEKLIKIYKDKCPLDKYDCSKLSLVILSSIFFKGNDKPLLSSMAWFNYFLNKTSNKIKIKPSDIENSVDFNNLNNKLIERLKEPQTIIEFIEWYNDLSDLDKKNKEKFIIEPSIKIIKKEFTNIRNITKPNNMNMKTWKYMEKIWYLRWLSTTILPVKYMSNDYSEQFKIIIGKGNKDPEYYRIKQITRASDTDKVITGMCLYHRNSTIPKPQSSIFSSSSDTNQVVTKSYVMGRFYQDITPINKDDTCDENSVRVMGLGIKNNNKYYQLIDSHSLACSYDDNKVKLRSNKYIMTKKNGKIMIRVGNTDFELLDDNNTRVIIKNTRGKPILRLEYKKTVEAPQSTQASTTTGGGGPIEYLSRILRRKKSKKSTTKNPITKNPTTKKPVTPIGPSASTGPSTGSETQAQTQTQTQAQTKAPTQEQTKAPTQASTQTQTPTPAATTIQKPSNKKCIATISMSNISIIDVYQDDNNNSISYDITSNGYVMRDQFNMDILGYRTIDALIHLYVINIIKFFK